MVFNWIELAFDKRIARVVPVVFVACTSENISRFFVFCLLPIFVFSKHESYSYSQLVIIWISVLEDVQTVSS